MRLFQKCNRPDCNEAVDPSNRRLIKNGAFLKVVVTCNNSHEESWISSSVVGEGKSQYPEINLLMV